VLCRAFTLRQIWSSLALSVAPTFDQRGSVFIDADSTCVIFRSIAKWTYAYDQQSGENYREEGGPSNDRSFRRGLEMSSAAPITVAHRRFLFWSYDVPCFISLCWAQSVISGNKPGGTTRQTGRHWFSTPANSAADSRPEETQDVHPYRRGTMHFGSKMKHATDRM